MQADFIVGEKEKIIVNVYCSAWSGLQVYKANDKVIKKIRSFKSNDIVEFFVGDEEKHHIRIVLKSIPNVSAQAYVDGKLYVDPLFKEVKHWRERNSIKFIATFVLLTVIFGVLGRVAVSFFSSDVSEWFGFIVVMLSIAITEYLFKSEKFPWFKFKNKGAR